MSDTVQQVEAMKVDAACVPAPEGSPIVHITSYGTVDESTGCHFKWVLLYAS
jgi:hypothetical protein